MRADGGAAAALRQLLRLRAEGALPAALCALLRPVPRRAADEHAHQRHPPHERHDEAAAAPAEPGTEQGGGSDDAHLCAG
eukprot:gene26385-19240_t